MRQDFPEREVFRLQREASAAENAAFDCLGELRLASDAGQPRDGAMLLRTTIEKALFSSPAACLQTLKERLRKLQARDAAHPDVAALQELQTLVAAIGPAQFSKFQHLLAQLRAGPQWQWDGRDPTDRLVLFTERIETLKFLQAELPRALDLPAGAVAVLHGQLPDVEIQDTVKAFGSAHSPLRLLIASDVASEGLNLHYQSHRLIHFDISWSLMVFQQRNGRVDRYGQLHVPRIGYLLTEPHHARIRGDLRYLEILIDKDEQAARNIGDPSAFMGLYDEELEVAEVAVAMQGNTTAEAFAAQLAQGDVDPFEALWSAAQVGAAPAAKDAAAADVLGTHGTLVPAPISAPTGTLPSLFTDDYRYVRDALTWLRHSAPRSYNAVQSDDAKRTLSFQPSADLATLLLRELSSEMWPVDNQFALSTNQALIQTAIEQARDSNTWPQLHYLWPLHPIVQWLDLKLMGLFKRLSAPVIRVAQGVQAGQAIVLVLAQAPNRRGQTMLTQWMGVPVDALGQPRDILDLTSVLQRTGLADTPLANDGQPLPITHIQTALPAVVLKAGRHLQPIKQAFDADCRARMGRELAKLKTLRYKHLAHLELDFAKGIEQVNAARRKQRESDTVDMFQNTQAWITDTLELDDRAQFTIVAVLAA